MRARGKPASIRIFRSGIFRSETFGVRSRRASRVSRALGVSEGAWIRASVGCLAILLLSAVASRAQTSSQAGMQNGSASNSVQNSYGGSVESVPYSPLVRQLSLDDAITLGIQNNLALTLARQNQQTADAQKLQLMNYLLPNLSLHGEHGVHQIDLSALGFRPSLFSEIHIPGLNVTNFPSIATVNTTIGQVNFSQELFTWAGWDVWKAAKANERSAYYAAESSRGLVVLNVGTAYLHALADSSQMDYARALLKTDETLLYQAHQEHLAGTAANLDELRARVQYQTQQQAVIVAENNFEKDKIALNRQIGLAPAQPIQLNEAAPFADLAAMTISDARAEAYRNRQDFQQLKQQMIAAHLERQAAKHERFPSIAFKGNYGVTGVNGGIYHGTFAAIGTLSVPIFEEAKFRGDRDAAMAQEDELRSQMNDLTTRIDQQLRDSLLDLQTASDLVRLARSNVDLATTALDQSQQRFRAGVDDNLPVVEAQAALAQAQTQYVNSVFQFNQAKLGLARNLGIVDTQYKAYLQGGHPTALPDTK
jgi:outer membrane protein TolC